MTKDDLQTLVISAIEALKKGKGCNLKLLDTEDKGLTFKCIILYDAPGAKIERIVISFHTSPLPDFDFDVDGVSVGKAIVKRIYSEIKTIDQINSIKNP